LGPLLTVLLAGWLAPAALGAAPPVAIRDRVAVLPVDANAAAAGEAQAMQELLVTRLASTPGLHPDVARVEEARFDAATRRRLLATGTCETPECWAAVARAAGTRYVVSGRVDRFDKRFLVGFNLLDLTARELVVHPRAEAPHEDVFLRTADELARGLEKSLAGRVSGKNVSGFGPVVGLRINNSFIRDLSSVNPGADLELGVRFHPEWVGFLQVGFSVVRSDEPGSRGGVSVLPSVVGARHLHRIEDRLRPYWGVGLGVQLAFGPYGIFQKTGSLPNLIGFAGGEFVIARHLALQIELGTNIAQATLGLAGDGGLGSGLNLDVNAGISYYF